MSSGNISEGALRALIELGTPVAIYLVGARGGFAVTLISGDVQKVLCNSRGTTRLFASLNTATEFLSRMGVTRFGVDASKYEAGRLRKARPDRAAALRQTRTAMRQETLI